MMTDEERAARDELNRLRAVKRGILQSMQRIRLQLMRPGEWADPTVLPLDTINARLISDSGGGMPDVVAHACHQHTLRWLDRQRTKETVS